MNAETNYFEEGKKAALDDIKLKIAKLNLEFNVSKDKLKPFGWIPYAAQLAALVAEYKGVLATLKTREVSDYEKENDD